jgi:hypothetical protein
VWSRLALRARPFGAAARPALLALAACSGGPSKKPERPIGARVDRRLDPVDIMPADLDLVMRIDVARMRAGIGPAVADALSARAVASAEKDVIKSSLLCADVVWIGARAGEIEGGDHVVVVEGKDCAPEANLKDWKRVGAANAQLTIYRREGRAPRDGTAEVIALSPRTTPSSLPSSSTRPPRAPDGADDKRGDPKAEGLISLDLRLTRLPPSLEKKFPSIGGIVAGLTRVRATAVLVDEGVQIDAQILSPTVKGAERARKFLDALVENLGASRYKKLLEGVKVEQIESTLRVHLVVPKALILVLVAAQEEATSPAR